MRTKGMHDVAPGKHNAVGSHAPAHAHAQQTPAPGRTTLVEQTHAAAAAPAAAPAQRADAHADDPRKPQAPARGSVPHLEHARALGKAKQHARSPEDEELDRENDEDVTASSSNADHHGDHAGDHAGDQDGDKKHPHDHKPNTAQKHGGGEIHIITRAGLRHLRQAGREGRQAARLLYNNPNAYVVLKEGQQIPNGWRCKPTILFPSYAEFKAALEGGNIPKFVEAVVYDNEHWAQTPHEEKTNAAHYAKLFGQLAHSHGWTFIAAPTRKWFAADARYADIIDVQLQSREVHKQSYLNTLKHDAKLAHHLNPDINLVTQISSNRNHLDPDHSGNIGAGIHKAEAEILESADYVDGFWGYLYQRNHKSVKAGQQILTDLAKKKKNGADI